MKTLHFIVGFVTVISASCPPASADSPEDLAPFAKKQLLAVERIVAHVERDHGRSPQALRTSPKVADAANPKHVPALAGEWMYLCRSIPGGYEQCARAYLTKNGYEFHSVPDFEIEYLRTSGRANIVVVK